MGERYYVVSKNHEIRAFRDELVGQRAEVDKAWSKFAKKYGTGDFVQNGTHIRGICLDRKSSDIDWNDWILVKNNVMAAYRPHSRRKACKALYEEWQALPVKRAYGQLREMINIPQVITHRNGQSYLTGPYLEEIGDRLLLVLQDAHDEPETKGLRLVKGSTVERWREDERDQEAA